MVYRVFVEKKPELANDARSLLSEAKQLPGVEHLERVRILNRYDVEHITPELFDYAVKTVFSEPQVDLVTREADTDGASVFAVEYLPGQFDQRADSAAQCIQIISQGERPDVRTGARVPALRCADGRGACGRQKARHQPRSTRARRRWRCPRRWRSAMRFPRRSRHSRAFAPAATRNSRS